MDHIVRRVVYIQAAHRPPLFVRFRQSCYYPVVRILTPEKVPWDGQRISVGDLLEIKIKARIITMDVGEDTDFTDEPKLVFASAHRA